MLSQVELTLIMPNGPPARLAASVDPLNLAMKEASINNVTRAAAFLGQLAHESADLKYMEEIADGSAYEGRKDLGNLQVGDGKRYKGRGPIQLTGRANYKAAGLALGLDLEAQPTLAADVKVGFRVSCWYWKTRDLNKLADAMDFQGITRRINGGLNGLDDRLKRYHRALEVLGVAAIF